MIRQIITVQAVTVAMSSVTNALHVHQAYRRIGDQYASVEKVISRPCSPRLMPRTSLVPLIARSLLCSALTWSMCRGQTIQELGRPEIGKAQLEGLLTRFNVMVSLFLLFALACFAQPRFCCSALRSCAADSGHDICFCRCPTKPLKSSGQLSPSQTLLLCLSTNSSAGCVQ